MVSGSELFSLLNGFSGYNQVVVEKEDRLKTTFRSQWGTFAYRMIPFGLIDTGVTFQRAMDIDFHGLVGRSVVVYLDEVTVHYKKTEEHMFHLKKLERCRKYGITLNPNKSVFVVLYEKILGHIISNKGISIDLERIKAIA